MSDSIDFSSLVLGFSSAALSYFGFRDDGSQDFSRLNLELAKQNIDIIALLKEKTKGNLSEDEIQLTDEVLRDLRMKFVESMKAKS
jgi:hypothetical protein